MIMSIHSTSVLLTNGETKLSTQPLTLSVMHLAPPWTSLKALNIQKSLQGFPSLSTAARWYAAGTLSVREDCWQWATIVHRRYWVSQCTLESMTRHFLPGTNPAASSGRQEKVENMEKTLQLLMLLTCCVAPSSLLFSWFVDNATLGDLVAISVTY